MPYRSEVAMRRVGCDQWVLLEDLIYEAKRERFTAKAGYITDFASSPRLFQVVVPRTGPWDDGAVTHDLLCTDLRRHYDQVKAGHLHPDPPLASARDTDGILRRIIREYHEAGVAGCGPLTQWTVWAGIRWGALANPARRAGWWRDAPAVAAITAGWLLALVASLLTVHALVDVALALLL